MKEWILEKAYEFISFFENSLLHLQQTESREMKDEMYGISMN